MDKERSHKAEFKIGERSEEKYKQKEPLNSFLT